MASIQVAGFGGEINIEEIIVFTKLFALALVIVNVVFALDNESIFKILQDRVIGFPECKSVIANLVCLAPSETSLKTIGSVFAGTFSAKSGLQDLLNLVFSSFDIVKGIVGLFVVIISGTDAVMRLYQWYFYWGTMRGSKT